MAFRFWSGPAETIYELAQAQKREGHRVHVAIDQSPDAIATEEPAMPYFRDSGLLLPGSYVLSPRRLMLSLLKDILFFRHQDGDIFHCHTAHDHALINLSHAFRDKHRPKIVRSLHKPSSAAFPLFSADGFTLAYPGLRSAVPASSPSTILEPLLSPDYTCPIDKELSKSKCDIQSKHTIGMVSTFKETRNHLLAIEAFAELTKSLPNAELVLVGDGSLESSIRQRVSDANLEGKVRFTGYLQRDAYIRYLQAFDLVWVLGLGNDWAARAAAQAKACGAQVVAVDLGGLSHFADTVVGLNPKDLARTTQRHLLAPQERQINRFTEHATTLTKFYQDLL